MSNMFTANIISVGNSAGIILPKEMLAVLRADKGDKLFFSETPGGFSMRIHHDDFAHKMAVAEKVMRKYRSVLKKLAE
jgi:putative addiction module antidote